MLNRKDLRGLTIELGSQNLDVKPEDFSKDSTGIGLLWEPATNLLCEYLETCCAALLHDANVLELGAGLGVAGMLCAVIGAGSVTLSDYHPAVLESLRRNVQRNFGTNSCCKVDHLSWGSPQTGDASHALLIGADLCVSERSAVLLAATVRSRLAKGGVFMYAHQERRAIFCGPTGQMMCEVLRS